jgi:hypothetical protein
MLRQLVPEDRQNLLCAVCSMREEIDGNCRSTAAEAKRVADDRVPSLYSRDRDLQVLKTRSAFLTLATRDAIQGPRGKTAFASATAWKNGSGLSVSMGATTLRG